MIRACQSNGDSGYNVVAVGGAGAAGMAAALVAAREGNNVCLFDTSSSPGGTVINCLIHTLGGFYDERGNLLNEGIAGELVWRLRSADPSVLPRRMGRLWVLNACPKVYRRVVFEWLHSEPRIELLPNAYVTHFDAEDRRVTGITVYSRRGRLCRRINSLIDATGTGQVVRKLDPDAVVYERCPAAGGLILRLTGVAPGALDFPHNLAVRRALQAAASDGSLPLTCGKAWLDAGVVADEAYLKMFVPLPEGWHRRELRSKLAHSARREGLATVTFLRRRPEFSRTEITHIGRLGVREGGRIRGEYCLTRRDVWSGRRFDDPACQCSWPIEYWDSNEGVSVEHLPHSGYDIPLRSLKVAGWENVWAAGKCLSADRYAQASARVVGACWAMGAAAGHAVSARAVDLCR